jgi:hypothetical protein
MLGSSRKEITDTKEDHIKQNNLGDTEGNNNNAWI